MKQSPITRAILVALTAGALSACGSSSDDSTPAPSPDQLQLSFGMTNSNAIALDSNLPIPNDIYFLDADGVVQDNLVVMGCGATDSGVETNVENATKCSLEALDGWSTTAPFSLPISGDLSQLDPESFATGVQLFFDKTDRQGNVVTTALVYGDDFTVAATEFGHLQILPLTVLAAETSYTLVLTSALSDIAGNPVLPANAYQAAKAQTDAIGDHINAVEQRVIAADNGISADAILFAAQFTTQSIGKELQQIALNSNVEIKFNSEQSRKLPIGSDLPLCLPGTDCVEVLQGTISLPSYLATSDSIASTCSADMDSEAEAAFWFDLYGADAHQEAYRFTPESCQPLYQAIDFSDENRIELAVQMVLPPKKSSGFPAQPELQTLPVMLSAHGITAIKELGNGGMLTMDNFVLRQVADQGVAVIGIDHVYHGTRSIRLDSSAADAPFDISVSSSVRGLFPGYDFADTKNFLKADALLTSRDNFRKVVADIINLKAAIAFSIDSNPQQYYQLDADNISIYGHSMGAIAATSAAGIESLNSNDFNGVILANPGGAIGGIVMNSNWLGKDEVPPAIKTLPEFRLRIANELGIDGTEQQQLDAIRALAETDPQQYLAKVTEIEPQYLAEFQYLIQAVIDTADPLNYAKTLKDAKQPMLSITAVGNKSKQDGNMFDGIDAGFTAADQTVPIEVEIGDSTMFTRCIADAEGHAASSDASQCAFGTEQVPYYALNVTEFPLAGAKPLETALGLNPVTDGGTRSFSRLIEGNHNIGVGTLTDNVSQGTRDYATVNSASTELATQTVQFIEFSGEVPYPNPLLLEK